MRKRFNQLAVPVALAGVLGLASQAEAHGWNQNELYYQSLGDRSVPAEDIQRYFGERRAVRSSVIDKCRDDALGAEMATENILRQVEAGRKIVTCMHDEDYKRKLGAASMQAVDAMDGGREYVVGDSLYTLREFQMQAAFACREEIGLPGAGHTVEFSDDQYSAFQDCYHQEKNESALVLIGTMLGGMGLAWAGATFIRRRRERAQENLNEIAGSSKTSGPSNKPSV